MADPRPLTREELARFLPNQRAVRAFEKLFDLIPDEFGEVLFLAESALNAAQYVKTENERMKTEIGVLKLELAAVRRAANLDNIKQRLNVLETLEG